MISTLAVGCLEHPDRCKPLWSSPSPTMQAAPPSGAWAEMTIDKDPPLNGTATLVFHYEFRYPGDPSDIRTWVASGYFEPSREGVFSYVSGDSSWVDTVRTFERRTHAVQIRVFRAGEYLIQAYVGAPVNSGFVAGATDNVRFCVR
jgi:hypothetical protein